MRQSIWTTRDKGKIPVAEMSSSHLLNTHRYLCRSLRELLVGMNQRDFEVIPVEMRGRVYGAISWINILEQAILDRHLEPLVCRPNHPTIEDCVPKWSSRNGNRIPITHLPDADLLQIHQNIGNRIVDLADLYNFALGPLAPGEDTMAADHLDGVLHGAIEEEIFVNEWIVILNSEVRRRGLESRSVKKPMPRARMVSEEPGPGGRGKIMQLEWEEVELPGGI